MSKVSQTHRELYNALSGWDIEAKLICDVIYIPRAKCLKESTKQPSTKNNMLSVIKTRHI